MAKEWTNAWMDTTPSKMAASQLMMNHLNLKRPKISALHPSVVPTRIWSDQELEVTNPTSVEYYRDVNVSIALEKGCEEQYSINYHPMRRENFESWLGHPAMAAHQINSVGPKIMVIYPSHVVAYPGLQILSAKYGLNIYEPRCLFTKYLSNLKESVYFVTDENGNVWSSKRVTMDPKYFQCLLDSAISDGRTERDGYIIGGLNYVLTDNIQDGYQYLRKIFSNLYHPDVIIYVQTPTDVLESSYQSLSVDPPSTYSILDRLATMDNELSECIYEGRVTPGQQLPEGFPMYFTIEHGQNLFYTLQNWKKVKSRVFHFHGSMKVVPDDEKQISKHIGMQPDAFAIYKTASFDVDFDMAAYYRMCLYISYFVYSTKPSALITFCVEPRLKRTPQLDKLIYSKNERVTYECNTVLRTIPAKLSSPEKHGRLFIRMTPINDGSSIGAVRDAYFKKLVQLRFNDVQRLYQSIKPTLDKSALIPKKLRFSDLESKIRWYESDLQMSPADQTGVQPTTLSGWWHTCPVSAIDHATLKSGHYNFTVKYKGTTLFMRNKEALYKFIDQPEYYYNFKVNLGYDAYFIVTGHRDAGTELVARALAEYCQIKVVFFRPARQRVAQLKHIYNYAVALGPTVMMSSIQASINHLENYAEQENKRFRGWVKDLYKIMKASYLVSFYHYLRGTVVPVKPKVPQKKELYKPKLPSIFPRINFKEVIEFTMAVTYRNVHLYLGYLDIINKVAEVVRRSMLYDDWRLNRSRIKQCTAYLRTRLKAYNPELAQQIWKCPTILLSYMPPEFVPKGLEALSIRSPAFCALTSYINDVLIRGMDPLTPKEEIDTLMRLMYLGLLDYNQGKYSQRTDDEFDNFAQIPIPSTNAPAGSGMVFEGVGLYPENVEKLNQLGARIFVVYISNSENVTQGHFPDENDTLPILPEFIKGQIQVNGDLLYQRDHKRRMRTLLQNKKEWVPCLSTAGSHGNQKLMAQIAEIMGEVDTGDSTEHNCCNDISESPGVYREHVFHDLCSHRSRLPKELSKKEMLKADTIPIWELVEFIESPRTWEANSATGKPQLYSSENRKSRKPIFSWVQLHNMRYVSDAFYLELIKKPMTNLRFLTKFEQFPVETTISEVLYEIIEMISPKQCDCSLLCQCVKNLSTLSSGLKTMTEPASIKHCIVDLCRGFLFKAAFYFKYLEKTYYFCSKYCVAIFLRNPLHYVFENFNNQAMHRILLAHHQPLLTSGLHFRDKGK